MKKAFLTICGLSVLFLSVLLTSCGEDPVNNPDGSNSNATHLLNQESVISTSDLGLPYLNTDKTVSFFTAPNGQIQQNLRIKQNGEVLDNTFSLSGSQEAEALDLLSQTAKQSLDNGITVRFSPESTSGNPFSSQDPEEEFDIYMYATQNGVEGDRIKLNSLDSYELSAGQYSHLFKSGVVTYSDDNEIHFVYTYLTSTNPYKWKVGFIVLDDQLSIKLNAELPTEFELDVIESGVTGGDWSYTIPNTAYLNYYPPKRAINIQDGRTVIIKSKSGQFYYVVAAIDYNPSYRSGNQIILKGDYRTHIYKFQNNSSSSSWQTSFSSEIPAQGNYLWFYMDRYLLTSSDDLLFSALMDVRGKSAFVKVDQNGNKKKFNINGYVHSFNELSNGAIGVNGYGFNNDRTATFKFTGVLNPDLTYNFNNTDTEDLSDFIF